MAKAIMIQGTTSNAGKSWVVAGLCRIFKQDGYKVAPFKSQNMALNSFITKDGLEMGRAQVVQAEAAGVEPSVLMNPILLKPTNDTSSQVIVNGEVWEDMSAKEYYQQKKVLVPQVKEAFDTLAAENDIIVIEGAGSPSEINLKENDIVNMYMAKLAKAPVLVVGDIDRGGVFASLVGTMVLFDQSEKDMVKGLLINKFRGDKTILEPGLDILSEKAGKPVLGVIPYLQVDIEDEDSLTERFHTKDEQAVIDLAVIRIPRISNFTDFNVFETIKGVGVRYVDKEMDFGNPDMVFIPGTKNTMEDLLWMRQNGIEGRIKQYAAQGNPVFGICGGYQMLGEQLKDPEGVEHGGTLDGIGLLPSVTTFEKQKIRTRVEGEFCQVKGIFSALSGRPFEGYEIHMGTTLYEEDL
ncbi:MAG: cobyric acid synthase, partial [Anaerovoracaceae bacterium]